MAYGRSLPEPELADFPIRGYEFYDYRHELNNVTFVNFEDNATRKTGALSYLLFTSFGVSSNNAIEHVKFENAKPAYFPPMAGNAKWANDNGNSSAYKTAVIRDKDGSLGAGPNAYILINDGVNDSIAVDTEACEIKPTWNAAVCKGDVGRMNVGGGGGPVGFGRGRGGAPGAAPGAAGGRGGPGAPGAQAAAPGAAAGRGGPGAAGGRAGGAGAPAQPPVVLSLNGKDFPATGATNVRAGTEYKVTTERPSLSLSVTELDAGSWVMFELPGFTTASTGTEQSSLDALRNAGVTSYYKGNGSLWVKVVSTGDILGSGPGRGPGPGDTLQVSR